MVQTEHENHAHNICILQIHRRFHLEMAGNIARTYQKIDIKDINHVIKIHRIVHFYSYFCFTESSEEINIGACNL